MFYPPILGISGIAKVGTGRAQAQPILSSAQPTSLLIVVLHFKDLQEKIN